MILDKTSYINQPALFEENEDGILAGTGATCYNPGCQVQASAGLAWLEGLAAIGAHIMDGRAKTAEDIMGEIEKLCQLIDEAETEDTPLKRLNEQLHEQIAEHKRSEKKLSEDANLLQSILGAMHSGISIRDLDYTVTYQNDVVTKIFGNRTGEKCYKAYEGKDEICEGCPVELAYKDGRSHTSVRKVVSPSGETMYWDDTANPIRDAEGNITSCLEICENITERKNAEEQLLENEGRFRSMMEQSPSVIEFYDTDGLQIGVNRAYEVLWGFPASHTVNKFNVLKSKEVEDTGLMDYVKRAYAGEAVVVPEYEFDSTGETEGKGLGRMRWLSTRIYPLKDNADNVKNIVITHEDITDRKEAEEELARSEERFRRAVMESPFPIMIHAEDGEVVGINKVWTELTGYEPEEISTISAWTERAYGEHKDVVEKQIDKIFDCETRVDEGEYAISSKDGKTLIWDFSSASLGKLPDGRRVVISIAKDVTDRKRAEESLRRSESELKAVYENAPLVMLLVDRERRVVKVNAQALSMARRPMEESMGLRGGEALRCVHAFDDARGCGFGPACEACGVRNAVLRAFESGNAVHRVEALIPYDHPDGPVEMRFIVSAIPLTELEEVFVLVCLEDITESKQAERLLKQNEERFRLLYEESPIGYQSLDAEGCIVEVNPAWLSLLGYEKDEVIGRSIADFLADDFGKLFKERFPCFKAVGEISALPFEMIKKDGSHIEVEIDGRIGYNPDGSFRQTHCVLHDVTERKQAEKELKRHQAELAHIWRVNTMGEMASGLAHELNQPLCAILNYAGACSRIMKGQTDESGQVTDALEEISGQANRAGQIIRRLRNLVAKGEPRQSTVCINAIVEEVLEMEKAEALDQSIAIDEKLGHDLPTIVADPIQIEQVVLNIVRNAFDAVGDKPADERRVTVRTSVGQDNCIEVAVSDTGIGLISDIRERLFDPFFTTKAKGLGVGLSLSKSIIEAHGGKLRAEPNQDGGATFRFTLPVKGK